MNSNSTVLDTSVYTMYADGYDLYTDKIQLYRSHDFNTLVMMTACFLFGF